MSFRKRLSSRNMVGFPQNTNFGVKPSSSYCLFTNQVPTGYGNDSSYELGMKFQVTKTGHIQGIKFWKHELESGEHIGKIWNQDGILLKSVVFINENNQSWQTQMFAVPLLVYPGITYIISVNNNYSYVHGRDSASLQNSVINKELFSVADGNNGTFNVIVGNFPSQSFNNSNYFRDVIFTPSQ